MAESDYGRQLYQLHDNGLYDFSNQSRGPTPMQRVVYMKAKAYHTEQQKSNAESSSLKRAQSLQNKF